MKNDSVFELPLIEALEFTPNAHIKAPKANFQALNFPHYYLAGILLAPPEPEGVGTVLSEPDAPASDD